MIETLERTSLETPVVAIKWHDETSGIVTRTILRFNDRGERMAYACLNIEAETGFKASVLGWDKIRELVQSPGGFKYYYFGVQAPDKVTKWADRNLPRFSPIGTPDTILLTSEGDLSRNE